MSLKGLRQIDGSAAGEATKTMQNPQCRTMHIRCTAMPGKSRSAPPGAKRVGKWEPVQLVYTLKKLAPGIFPSARQHSGFLVRLAIARDRTQLAGQKVVRGPRA